MFLLPNGLLCKNFLCLLFATLMVVVGVAAEDGYRLPKTFHPENYRLKVITHLDEDGQGLRFTGKVWILAICDQDTNNITLHAKNLTINDEKVKVKLVHDKIELKGVTYQPDDEFMIITAAETFRSGNKYLIYIPFEAPLSESLQGYYRSSYYDQKTKQKRFLSVTQFEPTAARYAFPCFDEPEMKATFDISLGHHKQYTALSNMPLKESVELEGQPDFILDTFETSVPMSTYLVAYTINDFEYRESVVKMKEDVAFRIWARRDAIDQTDYARDIGPRVLKYYEDYFDIKFPLKKMDMIAIPDFAAGAMENWGLITYRETALLYAPNVSSTSAQHRVASVIAHELAHQWFGNYVTMKWWTDLWLNEGFATYVASLGVDHLHPEWNSLTEESVDNTLHIFKFDALRSSHAVSVPIGHPSQINQIFDAISYSKGSCIIRMMHLYLGEDAFRNGVSNYLKLHKYRNAEQDDLWKALTEEAHKTNALPPSITVKQIMDSWTLKVGYPVISMERNYKNNSAELRQQRYLQDIHRTKDETNYCYYVPLSFTTKKEDNFTATHAREWLDCDCKNDKDSKLLSNIASEDEWIILNLRLAGLYKVKYDQRNWDLLIEQLNQPNFKKIDTINRAQLINDALDFAWSGDQNYDIALSVINYLQQEDEYLPWKAALDGLRTVDRILRKTPMYDLFRDYMKLILQPSYERFDGLSIDATNKKFDYVKHKVMIASWSCKFDVGDCVDKSVGLFSDWMAKKDPDTENPVPIDLRGVVYCNAIRQGRDREWNFLWKRYRKSNVASEKALIINSLACARQPWILARFLILSLNDTSGIRSQDAYQVFDGVASNSVGFDIARDFFFEKIDEIYAYLQPETHRLTRFIKPLARQMASQKEYTELKNLFDEKPVVFVKASQGVKQALETIELNQQWKQNNYLQIARQLSNTIHEARVLNPQKDD